MTDMPAVVGLGVLAGAALALGGCALLPALLPGSRRRESTRTREQDRRFAEFTEYVPKELEIRTDLEPLEKRMPGIRFSSAHWVAQYQQRERELLPAPDRPIWTHVVATLEPDGARALAEASTDAVTCMIMVDAPWLLMRRKLATADRKAHV